MYHEVENGGFQSTGVLIPGSPLIYRQNITQLRLCAPIQSTCLSKYTLSWVLHRSAFPNQYPVSRKGLMITLPLHAGNADKRLGKSKPRCRPLH